VTRYLETVLEERWQQWERAYRSLRLAGWPQEQLLAAMDVLNGWGLTTAIDEHGIMDSPQAIALELHDAEQLNGICAKWQISPKDWEQRIRDLDARQSRDLATLAREFWSGNQEMEQRLRGKQ
jgi:hypothetical protein